jgi:pyruvate dehydrogenase E2 component (dihydrolipoamide acetyltransferase)
MPEVLMPRLSDTMTEGVIGQWVKQEGDEVRRGDVLAEIETDKATMELEAYDNGVLTKVLVPAGETVPIGRPIALIGEEPGQAAAGSAAPPSAAPPSAAEATQPAPPRPETPPEPAAPGPTAGTAIRTSPLARAIARDHGIDLATVRGTGPGGRIVRADVEAAVAAHDTAPAAPSSAAPAPAAAPGVAPVATATDDVEEIPLTAVRRVTARRLAESTTVPHFDLTTVVDAGALLAFRAQVNERLAPGPRVSVTDLLVRACAVTLREYPQLNSSWGEDKILRHRRVHIGVAVALDEGLIVPVVRDADRKSVGEISAEIRALAERARAGRLSPDEFTGGTFTISNLGMFDVEQFVAIINPPQAAILAIGSITESPVVKNGEIVIGHRMKIALSCDHRISDGAEVARFLIAVKNYLQSPMLLAIS